MASIARKLRNHGSVPGRGTGLFSYARCSDWFCAPLNLLNGYSVAPSLSVRRTGLEGDHTHLPTNEVTSVCSCTCTPSYAFKVSTRTLPLPYPPPSQMKPTRCTLLLGVFISTSLHVSGNYVANLKLMAWWWDLNIRRTLTTISKSVTWWWPLSRPKHVVVIY